MDGLSRNVKNLFSHDGTLFVAAFDHPQMYGVMESLKKPLEMVERCCTPNLDGFILNPGIFPLLDAQTVAGKKLIMRASLGGSLLSGAFSDVHQVIASPEEVIRAGADAVLIMMVMGSEREWESMSIVARAVDAFHAFSIPVIVEVLAADYTKNNDHDFVKNGARIAAELGADVIKAFYCERFEEVVEGCPVPIILAGGPKDTDIVTVASEVVAAGVKGFAFGRNIFEHPAPETLITRLSEVLRK